MYEAFSAKFVRNVDANRTIKDELTAAIRTQGARRRISVTDLVNPRQAFFRRTRPDIQPSAERAQTMMTGTGVHAQFERTISTEEFAEQFVTYEDIVGKIDIYEDAPVELKTTSFQDRDGVVRPSYLDQLGMYCAMTGIPRGHLVVYYTPRSGDGAVLSAYAVELSNSRSMRSDGDPGRARPGTESITSSFPGRRRTDSNPMRSSRRMNRARPGSRRSGGAVSTRRSPRRCNTDSREDSGVSLSGC